MDGVRCRSLDHSHEFHRILGIERFPVWMGKPRCYVETGESRPLLSNYENAHTIHGEQRCKT